MSSINIYSELQECRLLPLCHVNLWHFFLHILLSVVAKNKLEKTMPNRRGHYSVLVFVLQVKAVCRL